MQEPDQTVQTPEELPKISRKQRVLEAQGKEVPLDLFLYSCLENERLLKANPNHIDHQIRWPLPDDAGAVARDELGELVKRMTAWYADTYPNLAATTPLDHAVLNDVIAAVVGIARDLARVYQAKTGEALPGYDKTAAAEVWNLFAAAMQKTFPTRHHLFTRYAQWSFGVEKEEEFEPGSRPPVGRFAPPPPRRENGPGGRFGRGGDRGDRGPRGGGGGDRGPRGDSDRGPRGPRDNGDRGPRGPRHDDGSSDEVRFASDDEIRDVATGGEGGGEGREARGDRGPRGGDRGPRGGGDRGPRGGGDRGPRGGGDRGPRGGGDRGPRGGGDRGPRRNDEETAKLEAAALAEVDRAVERLRTDKSVDEVTLAPTNSFYRRIQHQKAIDMGFSSNSVGEGNDRAVKVARKDD